jgi:molybdopterin synthase sulfur carrier subunit
MPIIKLNAGLRYTAGTKEEIVEGNTLNEVINNLVGKIPALEGAIFNDGSIREQYLITLNGRHFIDLDQVVNEKDTIAIFPPISGG